MKKILLTIILKFVLCGTLFSQVKDIVILESTGFPDYRRLFQANKGAPIFHDSAYFRVEISSLDLQKCVESDFAFLLDSQQLEDLKNERLNLLVNDSITIIGNVLNIKKKDNREYEFDLSYSIEKKNLSFSRDFDDELCNGFLRIQNRFVRYHTFNLSNSEKSFHVAIIDKNMNGIIDENDIISLSYDTFFIVKPSRASSFIKDSIVVNFEQNIFLFEWLGGYAISASVVDLNDFFQFPHLLHLSLNQKCENLTLDNVNVPLQEFLISDLTLISYWASYCPPCVSSIPKLNALSHKVIGLQSDFHEKSMPTVSFRNFPIGLPS